MPWRFYKVDKVCKCFFKKMLESPSHKIFLSEMDQKW